MQETSISISMERIETVPIKAMANTTCGLDIHKDKIDACILINDGTEAGTAVHKAFSTMRGALAELRDWILSFGCSDVLMESTGVFWMPIYFLLEAVENMNVGLANAYHAKNVPGRPKTDKEDAKWMARLCMWGMVLKSYIVKEPFRNLREYTRYYKKLVQEQSRHKNRIEKLLQMNGFKLSSVLSDIYGKSGLGILAKLSSQGSLTVADISAVLDPRAKSTPEEVAYAINGGLKQTSRALLKFQLAKLKANDKALKEIYQCMVELSKDYTKEIGIIASIPGLSELSAMYIIAEIGTNFDSFKNSNYLTAWAGLAPKKNESADKSRPSSTKKANRYIKSVLVECAWAATRTRGSRLSIWYWHNVNRLGKKKAITGVARKLLRYIYAMVQNGTLYDASLDRVQEQNYRARKLDSARKIVDSNKPYSDSEEPTGLLAEKQKAAPDNPQASALEPPPDSTPVKKRGQPKKKLEQATENDATISASHTTSGLSQPDRARQPGPTDVPVKKKRGRPRKNPVSNNTPLAPTT